MSKTAGAANFAPLLMVIDNRYKVSKIANAEIDSKYESFKSPIFQWLFDCIKVFPLNGFELFLLKEKLKISIKIVGTVCDLPAK